mmetsp:Transcript_22089/g.61910  ORF Transcript_22089/g.61910 Transcript_22089/m.61910 type:complete len:400 (+) Transcript_22089:130-1329(+)
MSSRTPPDIALMVPNGRVAREAAECRLDPELRELASLTGGDCRDWRKLEPDEVIERFRNATESIENRTLLARSIFVGTAQALVKGMYWAPFASSPSAHEVDCKHLRRPHSRLYTGDRMPPLGASRLRPTPMRISTRPGRSTLDVVAEWWGGIERHRIAVVRFSALNDVRNERASYTHCRDDQLFLRTSYYQAFERLETDLCASINPALELGGMIYTNSVGILRGPIDEGAQWYGDPPRMDVMWLALPGHPQMAEQSQYACEHDRAEAAKVVERIFAWASALDVDVLVLPPLGCGTHGCQHPHLDMAGLLHDASVRYERRLPQLVVASDHAPHLANGWWDEFEDALRHGRPHIRRPMALPVPAYPRAAKDAATLALKAKKLAGLPTPRDGRARGPRRTFL